MKTVQQYLKELDTEKLVDTYVYMYPVDYEMAVGLLDMTLREIKEKHKNRVREYIGELSQLKVTVPEDDSRGLLFVHRCIKDGFLDEAFELVEIKDLRENGVKSERYGYEMSPLPEIMGYLVAETALTRRYIYELISNVLYEASFFGFDIDERKAEVDKVIASLENSEKERENGTAKYFTMEDMRKDYEERFGEPFDEESEDEAELSRKVTLAAMEYSRYSFEKELAMVIAELEKQQWRTDTN